MHHFVASLSHVTAGYDASHIADQILRRHNTDENLAYWSRDPIPKEHSLEAQVQALVALRIVQEYVTAMETTGALLRAIRNWRGLSLLKLNHGCRTRDVRAFYSEILAKRRSGISRMLNWPTLLRIERSNNPDLAARARRTFPMLRKWLVPLASMYLRGRPFRVVNLNRRKHVSDPRECIYVFLSVRDRGDARGTDPASMIVQGLNKLKHGFNATAHLELYRSIKGARNGIIAFEISKKWEVVNQLGQQIDLMGVICREAARFTLQFDDARLL